VPCTMAEAGQLQSISIYHSSGSGQMLLAVYADSAGKPGSRLGVTSAATVSSTQGWQTIVLQSPVSVSAGQKLWLAWVFQNSTGLRYAGSGGTPSRADSGTTWTGGMPTTFGISTLTNYIYSIYATYTTAASTTASYAAAEVASDGPLTETPNTMMRLHVRDTGKGINPASVTIEVDGNVVYSGDVELASTPYGVCARTGTQADYTYLYQPKESTGEQVVVAVNARDLAGNVLPEQTYLFTTATAVSDELALDPNNLDQRRPAAVGDSKGNVWSIWQAGDDGQRQIYISLASNGVETSDDTVQLTQGQGDHANPAMAVDGAGVLYAVWQQNVRGNWNVCLSMSADGKVWSAPKAIVDANDNQVNPAIAASEQPNGLVAVLWQEDRAGNQDVYMATSTDAFTTAEVTAVTSDDADQIDPAVFVDGEDALFMRWTEPRNDSTAPVEFPQEP